MSWIVWATLGYLLNAVAVAVDKTLLGRRELSNPAVYTVFISSLGLLVLVLAPWGWQQPGAAALGYGLASGACFTLALWSMFSVLKYGEASRVPAFIGSLSPLFVFLGSWLMLGERLAASGMAAFVLLATGGLVMVGGKGGLRGRGVLLAVLSAALFGLSFVLIKLTFQETSFVTGLIFTRVGGFLMSLVLLAVPGTLAGLRAGARASGTGTRFAFFGGQSAGALSGLFNSYAITLGSVTLVNALQGIQYIFLLLIAVAVSSYAPQLFKDEFSGSVVVRKLFGILCIGGGLWLLSV